MQFKDIIGQEEVKQHLIRSVSSGRVPHAQLFLGREQSGLLPLAWAYAQYLQCPHRTSEDSCGICPSCVQSAKAVHPDVHFVFPVVKQKSGKATVSDDLMDEWRTAILRQPDITYDDWMELISDSGKQGGIFVEESSAILQKLSFTAYTSPYKIVIIWMAEKMGTATANKLLKILEEPAPDTLFLLLAASTDTILPTVVSRTQLIRIPARTDDVERPENEELFDRFVTMMRAAYMAFHRDKAKNEMPRLLQWAQSLAAESREAQKAYLKYAMRMIRESYLVSIGMTSLSSMSEAESRFVKKFAPFVCDRNIDRLSEALDQAYAHIAANGNQQLVFYDTALLIAKYLHG